MKVSLILSVYNGETALRESIESILRQTYADFELVIVDDGSSDKTPAIIAEYAARDPRIKAIRNEENIGLTKSLNVGIRASSGAYVARMDAGDLSDPNRFAVQVAFLNEHPDHVLLGSWGYFINERGTVVGEMRRYNPQSDEELRKVFIRYNPMIHSSVMMRRDALERAGCYDERWRYAQDYELFFRMLQQGKAANIGQFLVSYRLIPNSITRRKNKEQTLCAIRARLGAIRRGQYGLSSVSHLWRPVLGYLMPRHLKGFAKKLGL